MCSVAGTAEMVSLLGPWRWSSTSLSSLSAQYLPSFYVLCAHSLIVDLFTFLVLHSFFVSCFCFLGLFTRDHLYVEGDTTSQGTIISQPGLKERLAMKHVVEKS